MEYLFKITTPLGVEVRTTQEYWEYLVTQKHPVMRDRENIVAETLRDPDEIRGSRIDDTVFLYYKRYDRLYCVVAKHTLKEGFLITAYPVDKTKEGDKVWTR